MSAWRACGRTQGALAPLGMLACVRGFTAPLDDLRECAAHASPALAGIKSLATQCPRLNDTLAALGIRPMLYDGWQEHLNRDALGDLVELAETYGGSESKTAPDIAALPGVLETLQGNRSPAPKSWWDAGIAWFKSWLLRHSDSFNWLDRWLGQIGRASSREWIMYGLMALVLVAAFAVVVNELKAAGALRRRRSAAKPASIRRDPAAPAGESAGMEPAALSRRPADLLRAIVSRLVQTGRLTAERSLTHRELVARSVFDNDSQRAVFAAVAGRAEAMLYGAQAGPLEDLHRILREGDLLLAHIEEASHTR